LKNANKLSIPNYNNTGFAQIKEQKEDKKQMYGDRIVISRYNRNVNGLPINYIVYLDENIV
jgi:hypothetical protein